MILRNLFLMILLFAGPFGYAQVTDVLLSDTVHLDDRLNESSGLAFAAEKLWTHNDSGGQPELYAVDPETGSITQTIFLEGAKNNDWEDLAADSHYLYIADTGNNVDGARTDLMIYKVCLDDIPAVGNTNIPADKIGIIRFYYPEQGLFPVPTTANNTAYDCEAIFVAGDTIHLFTKDWTSASSGYGTSEYLLPAFPLPEEEKYPAIWFKRHDQIGFMVTGADYSKETGRALLIGYQNKEGFGNHFLRVYSEVKDHDVGTGSVFVKNLGIPLSVGQAEAICFGEDASRGFISNEEFSFSISSYSFHYPAALRRFFLSNNPENEDKEDIFPVKPSD
jgi:hypothetical protein